MRIACFALTFVACCCTWSGSAGAQTTRPADAARADDDRANPAAAVQAGSDTPATRPSGPSAEEMLNQLLKPADEPRPLQPATAGVSSGGVDATSGAAAVAPDAPLVNVMREGTDIVNRVGRLTRSADGQQWEFTFESDGRTLLDPPVIVLPNLTLMRMESAISGGSRDLKFRITGEVTEYRGRNYVLLRRASVVPDAVKQF